MAEETKQESTFEGLTPAGKYTHTVTKGDGWFKDWKLYDSGHKVTEFDSGFFDKAFNDNVAIIERAVAAGDITWQEGNKMLGDWLDSARKTNEGASGYSYNRAYDQKLIDFGNTYQERDKEERNREEIEKLIFGNPDAEEGTLANLGLAGAIDREYQRGEREITKREQMADDMMADARLSEQDKQQFLGEASGNVKQSFQKVRDAGLREMGRYGVNPNSGRFVSSGRSMGIAEAASEADAKNRTRLGLRQMEKDNVNAARMVRIGLNPGTTPGSAVGAYTGAGLSTAGFLQNQNMSNQSQRNWEKDFGLRENQFGLSQDMWNFNKNHYWDALVADAVGAGITGGVNALIRKS